MLSKDDEGHPHIALCYMISLCYIYWNISQCLLERPQSIAHFVSMLVGCVVCPLSGINIRIKQFNIMPPWQELRRLPYIAPYSSVHVLECSLHVGYKWVMLNVSMTCSKTWEENNLFCIGIESPLQYVRFATLWIIIIIISSLRLLRWV